MTPSTAPALREALAAADFTDDRVAAVLGRRAHDALLRNETAPGLARTRGGSPLETLVRLFLLQTTVPVGDAERALPGLVDRLAVDGLLERSVGEVAARLDCRPHSVAGAPGEVDRDLWVVSDPMPGVDGRPLRVGPDHVLGVSPASTSLAQLTIREPVGSALDLGTGCGVQALHLAGHAGRVVATDVNTRALDLTRFNAALNGLEVDVRAGSFFEPVRGERFDLVVTNPPFVISPALHRSGERLVYRDSGLPGDRAVEHIVRTAPDHLAPGGWCQVLANWVVERGRGWDERLAGWLPARHDALIVQREVLDPAAYVELWLKDAGLHGAPDYLERYDTWLSWFDEQGVEAIGFGWIDLHAVDADDPRTELLSWPYEIEQPVAPAIRDWGVAARAVAAGIGPDDHLLARADVVQETHGPVGVEDPERIVLRQQVGLRRARTVDTVEAALVGACDGDLSVGAILDAVAALLGADAATTRTTYLPAVAELVAEGFLTVR